MNPSEYLASRRKEITAYDFNDSIHIEIEDGTSLKYVGAFAEIKDEWVFVFTEHFGYHFFEKEMVTSLKRSWTVTSTEYEVLLGKDDI